MDTAAIPTIKRRLACMVYEAMLLFGVIFFAEAILMLLIVGIAKMPVDTFSHSRQASLMQQVWVFLVLGLYFVYFWQKKGQTLPMQTWRIRLVCENGSERVPLAKACARYLLSWMWFVPGWFLGHFLGMNKEATIGLVALNVMVWATTAKFSKDSQFLHDRIIGTRLVSTLAQEERPKPA